MTAEIAILNRVGVALAADSAVTISSNGGSLKTYNTADKLFELNGEQPVAIMIYGSAEFMGIPAETIVKGYRESKYDTVQADLAGYARQFAEYMRHELPIERSVIISRIVDMVVESLSVMRNMAEADFAAAAGTLDGELAKPAVFVARRLSEIVETHISELDEMPDIEGVSDDNLPVELADIVGVAIEELYGEGMLERLDRIVEMVRGALLKPVDLGSDIGFVFAGFGTEQIFPAIEAFECDLALLGAIRIKAKLSREIDSGHGALITPFAQSEMVDRFMDGVDEGYTVFVREMVRGALSKFGDEVARRFQVDPVRARKANRELSALRDGYVEELEKASSFFRMGNYRRKILDVVQFMPKAELAEMAESLVNLTSIKRRVSAEHESVGGPIDVAFVSKYDGFTWIRRKGDAQSRGGA